MKRSLSNSTDVPIETEIFSRLGDVFEHIGEGKGTGTPDTFSVLFNFSAASQTVQWTVPSNIHILAAYLSTNSAAGTFFYVGSTVNVPAPGMMSHLRVFTFGASTLTQAFGLSIPVKSGEIVSCTSAGAACYVYLWYSVD